MGYLSNESYAISEKTIPVKLKRGDQVEYGRLVYKAYITKREEETGEPSTIWHPIDDRQCNWQVAGMMDRLYFVQSIMGVEDPMPASTVNVPLSIDGASNGLASFLDHDPCSDCRGRIDADVQRLRSSLIAIFDEVMNQDIERFKTEREGITVVINPEDDDAHAFFSVVDNRLMGRWNLKSL